MRKTIRSMAFRWATTTVALVFGVSCAELEERAGLDRPMNLSDDCPIYDAPPCDGGTSTTAPDPDRPGCEMPVCECPDDHYWNIAGATCTMCPLYETQTPACEGGTITWEPDPELNGCQRPVCQCEDEQYWDNQMHACRDCPDYDAPECNGGITVYVEDPNRPGCDMMPACRCPDGTYLDSTVGCVPCGDNSPEPCPQGG